MDAKLKKKQIEGYEKNIEDHIFKKLYCAKTHMIYDRVHGEGKTANIDFLPTPEEIKLQLPNPCSWGSGMEDSVLNGGSVMEGLLAKYDVTKDEKTVNYIKDIFKGLVTCATVSKQRGFLARSVSPVDKKSHFINSSRDQYTHWIYAAYLYYNHELCTAEEKAMIEKILDDFAFKAEQDITEENDYNLLREDGKIGMVQKMINVEPHEEARLLMFYAAAYYVTKNAHWLDKYHEYRERLLSASEKIDCSKYERVFPLLQMQYSLKVVYDIETDKEYKARYYALMKRIANGAMRFVQKFKNYVLQFIVQPGKDWRACESIHTAYMWNLQTLVGGYPYYVPLQEKDFEVASTVPIDAAEAFILGVVEDFDIDYSKEIQTMYKLMKTVGSGRCYNYSPVLVYSAYWLLRKKGIIN